MNFDDIKPELLAILDRGLKYAHNHYPEYEHELYIANTKSMDITIQSGMVNAIHGGQVGIGVRSVKDKKMGFASASGILDENVNFAIDNAVKLSNAISLTDKNWNGFVKDKKIGKEGKLDYAVVNYTAEEAVNAANYLFQEARAVDSRIVAVSGSMTISYGAIAIANTEDILKASQHTVGFGNAYVSAKEGDKTKNGFDYRMGRGIPDFTGVGTKGAENAIELLKSKPLNFTGDLPIVFDPLAAGQLISAGLRNSINGKSVVEGRSKWADQIGADVGVKGLNVYDDSQLPEDPGMEAIDGEGYARTTTKVIEDGILKTFLFDNYYSKVHGSENTGNASRRAQQSYEAIPSIGTGTLVVEPSSKSREQLIEEINNGVFVTSFLMGMGHSNLISGDFSIVSPAAFKIENGEISEPIDSITIAGNLYRSFKQIVGYSNEDDLTFIGKVPSVAYQGFTISG